MVCSNLVITLQSRQEPTMTVLASLRGWCNSGLSLYRHSLTKERLDLGFPYSSFILVILFVNSRNIAEHPSCSLSSVESPGNTVVHRQTRFLLIL